MTFCVHRDASSQALRRPNFHFGAFLSQLGPRHAHAFLPFGAGPRSCIGRQFALLSMQITVAEVLQRVRFELDPGAPPLQLSQAMSMKAVGGMPLRVLPAYESSASRLT